MLRAELGPVISSCSVPSVPQYLAMFLTPGLVLLTVTLLVPSSVLAGKCDDCVTVVAGLKEAALSEESLSMQQGMILSMICPEAGLGGPDDHPNCEK